MSHVKSYSNNVCLGNWFEDRVQARSGRNGRVIADYGCRIFETDSQVSWGQHADHGSHGPSRAQKLKSLQTSNGLNGPLDVGFRQAQRGTYDESVATRLSAAPETGFGSILPPAAPDPPPLSLSCNQYSYGVPGRTNQTYESLKRSPAAPFAGQGKPVKVKSNQPRGLSGEVWKDGSDPQNSTLAQRAWMYGEDPAIKYKLNGYPVLRPEDVEQASVALGVRAPYNPEGDFKRRAKITKCSDVRGSNNRPGLNIWMDEVAGKKL